MAVFAANAGRTVILNTVFTKRVNKKAKKLRRTYIPLSYPRTKSFLARSNEKRLPSGEPFCIT
jgi:elongation factor P--beta-lysine ligase